ncbi:DUF2207 domain-containing protein [Rhizobium viscosum]|uniref:Membrane protein YgcG n=1 Tax=Rhizobium viscosum TaxID=1673 RepID=A0ABR9IL18_RHIVS|nr:DUF2207 domain-containing protein [Rhizobium viscosum]MBE1503869.1 putative membrane protein YgcG [Rhizobium viscosum]
MIRRFFGICFALLLLFAAQAAIGEEFIASFDAAIQLEKSGALTVAETITVNAEGDRIRRGIFRDFPLTFRDANGRRRSVDFSVVSVKRDGRDEPWHTESITGGIRIYAGSEDVTISPGRHQYVFTYKTNRQIRYFDDHDELYWNVTGNGWIFPIRSAVATVTFPQGVVPEDVAVFTGPVGAAGKNARASVDDGRLVVATTAPLGAQEGLTFAAKLPKGAIDPPSADQESSWWFSDNRDYFIGFGGLILVFLYYTRSWLKVGRDPAREIVVPRWDPPSGISPALVNYVDNKGFSGQGWTALSATALDLAVRGYVTLGDLKDSILIRRTDKPLGKEKLQAGEAELLKAVGGSGDTLTIDKANGEKVKSVGQSFRSSIEREHRGKYYNSNAGYITGGVILSAAALVALFVFGSLEPDTIALMIIPIGISVFLSVFVAGFAKALHRGRSLVGKIFAVIAIAIAVFVGLSILSAVVLALGSSLMEFHETPMLFAVGGIVLLNILYFFIMGAPTPLGAKMTAGVDGLRQYLTLAEKDRMNTAGAPQMSPQHFETLLPYAVALGVEKPWSRTFETWLAAASAGAAAAAYSPGWYSGNFNSGSFSDRIGGFSSSMASTIASTIPSPPPSSSSSGFSGGGSSGGGGGGGGGGGW